jgi:Xaa-Pro aminopeptidase
MVEAAMRAAGARDVVDGSFVVRHIRRIKSAQEIVYIEEGVQLADLGLRAAEAVARPGVMECEVYGEAVRAMYAAGGEVQGINQGFNVRGLSHGYSGRHRIQSGDAGWFDLCGVVNRYHGNVCRSMYFRDPDKKTQEAFASSAVAFDIVRELARPGTDIRTLSAAIRKHFNPIASQAKFYFIGGYELGIAFPPDWVGEWTFDAIGGVAPGVFEAGMVTNFESIFYFEDEQGRICDTSNISTVVYGEDETRVLGSYPPEPIVIT